MGHGLHATGHHDLGLAGGELAGRVTDAAGSGASGDIQLPFVGGYAAFSNAGFAAVAQARYFALDMRLTDAPLAVFNQSQHASGMSYAAQASYRFAAGALYLEPEAGVSYTRLGLADEAANVGALSFGRAQLTLAHAGLRLGAEIAHGEDRIAPYLLAAVWRTDKSGDSIAVPQGPTIAPTGLAGFEQVGLGVSAAFARGFSLSAQGEALFGAKLSGLAASAEMRWRF